MKRDELGDLLAFLAVAEELSFTRAAVRLETSQSAISHTLRRLESRLGLRLLTRTTRSVSLTSAGETLLATLRPSLQSIDQTIQSLDKDRSRPAGLIRISASESASIQILQPVISQLLQDYPELQIELITEGRVVDIVDERFDAGVRLGELLEKDMVGVRVSPDMRMCVAGSPEYFNDKPKPTTPHDLSDHACINLHLISLGGLYAWEFEKNGRPANVRVSGQFISTNVEMIRRQALSGTGLVCLPRINIAKDLRAGKLISVLEDWLPTFAGYHLSYPRHREASPAMSVLVDALIRQRRKLDSNNLFDWIGDHSDQPPLTP